MSHKNCSLDSFNCMCQAEGCVPETGGAIPSLSQGRSETRVAESRMRAGGNSGLGTRIAGIANVGWRKIGVMVAYRGIAKCGLAEIRGYGRVSPDWRIGCGRKSGLWATPVWSELGKLPLRRTRAPENEPVTPIFRHAHHSNPAKRTRNPGFSPARMRGPAILAHDPVFSPCASADLARRIHSPDFSPRPPHQPGEADQ